MTRAAMLNELIASLVLPVPEPEITPEMQRSELVWGRVTDRYFREKARVLSEWAARASKEWRDALVDLHANPIDDAEWEALVAAHDLGSNFQSFEVTQLVYDALTEWSKINPDAPAVEEKTIWWKFKRQ